MNAHRRDDEPQRPANRRDKPRFRQQLGQDRAEYGFTFAQATGLGRWFQHMGDALEVLPGTEPPDARIGED